MKRCMNYPKWLGIMFSLIAVGIFLWSVIGLKAAKGSLRYLPIEMLILGSVLLIPAIIFDSLAISLNMRKRNAMNGKRSVGVVTAKSMHRSYRSQTKICKVSFTFKADNGQSICAIVYCSSQIYALAIEGLTIPIYVNGQDAFFVDAEFEAAARGKWKNPESLARQTQVNPYQTPKKKEYYVCPYCDSKILVGMYICPNCNAKNWPDKE